MADNLEEYYFGGLQDPEEFLLRDECVDDYDSHFDDLAADLRPRGALERRQVELIAQADVEISRQRRLTAALLRPSEADPQPPETQGERTLRLHHEALRTLNGKPAREPVHVLPEPSGPEATQFILRAHRRNIKDIEFHQRALAAAERSRRQNIDLLLKMQGLRRAAAVEDAEVIDASDGSQS